MDFEKFISQLSQHDVRLGEFLIKNGHNELGEVIRHFGLLYAIAMEDCLKEKGSQSNVKVNDK